jgi:hypothetical protein
MYEDPCYGEIVQAVGYRGMTYRELTELIETLAKRFDKLRVESATYHLVTFEGQMTCNPKPLAQVSLRAEVRKLAWQLLGPPPESSESEHFHQPGPWKPPWDRPPKEPPPEPQDGKPKRRRSRVKAKEEPS